MGTVENPEELTQLVIIVFLRALLVGILLRPLHGLKGSIHFALIHLLLIPGPMTKLVCEIDVRMLVSPYPAGINWTSCVDMNVHNPIRIRQGGESVFMRAPRSEGRRIPVIDVLSFTEASRRINVVIGIVADIAPTVRIPATQS